MHVQWIHASAKDKLERGIMLERELKEPLKRKNKKRERRDKRNEKDRARRRNRRATAEAASQTAALPQGCASTGTSSPLNSETVSGVTSVPNVLHFTTGRKRQAIEHERAVDLQLKRQRLLLDVEIEAASQEAALPQGSASTGTHSPLNSENAAIATEAGGEVSVPNVLHFATTGRKKSATEYKRAFDLQSKRQRLLLEVETKRTDRLEALSSYHSQCMQKVCT